MTWSLQLSNGDFTTGSARLGTVSDGAKLLQDMRCIALEPMGTDDMHLGYGSLLDGGTLADGTQNPGVIGLPPQLAEVQVNNELQRLAQYERAAQLARAQLDRVNYNRVTLTPGEVLMSLSVSSTIPQPDTLAVRASLTTAAGQDLTLALNLNI